MLQRFVQNRVAYDSSGTASNRPRRNINSHARIPLGSGVGRGTCSIASTVKPCVSSKRRYSTTVGKIVVLLPSDRARSMMGQRPRARRHESQRYFRVRPFLPQTAHLVSAHLRHHATEQAGHESNAGQHSKTQRRTVLLKRQTASHPSLPRARRAFSRCLHHLWGRIHATRHSAPRSAVISSVNTPSPQPISRISSPGFRSSHSRIFAPRSVTTVGHAQNILTGSRSCETAW